MKTKKEFIVTPEGSIALLALGHKGILAWKKAMLASKLASANQKKNGK